MTLLAYWFEKYTLEVTAIFSSVFTIFSNSDFNDFEGLKASYFLDKNLKNGHCAGSGRWVGRGATRKLPADVE